MKNTLKFGAIAAVAALSLAACGQAPAEQSSPSGDTTQSDAGAAPSSDVKACMVSDSGGFDDKSFNQSGHEGLMRAKDELGVAVDQAESQSDQDFVPNINNMVQGGCDIIIGVGFLMADAMDQAAAEHPDVKFALVDSTFASQAEGVDGLPNARALVFNTAEASYLAGYAAAAMTTDKVGTYLGANLPTTAIFADGFADGIAKYNEVHGKDVELVGWDKAKQEGMAVGNFEDVPKGKQFTEQLIEQGARVIMPVAGPVGAGTLAAAKDSADTWVVWVDADGVETQPEYKDIILTSVMKDIGNAVFDTIKAVQDGSFDANPYIGTLENGGVGIAPWHEFEDVVPQEIKDEIDQLKQDIIDGKIVVETVNAPK
ncbi:BMP family ABC transporter substrate-binding protein [Scrofimicrobium sp. R131]|uniref:BMP family ABC transporter substrate-binding protein n=1 Tax=Scrofimicrobium appendicitidis TaxID=3079930 RepID=A0AAU7V9D6_9ACTO